MIYHERLPDILALYRAGMRAFLLEGPAGSGKTSLGESLSKVLGHGCVTVSGCRDTEKSEITKGAHPVTGVERLSPFMRALCEGPTVGTIDEGDGIPPDVMLGLNQPSANRCLFVNGERRELHPDSVIIITANATNGASRTYTGRYPMDGATKSRFFPVFCDYSNNIEQTICPDVSIRAVVAGVRARVNNDPRLAKDFGAVVGTRLLIQASITGRAYGLSGEQAVSKVFELGYPADVARQLMGR
jgi:MoxR-like ATPase